MKTQEQDNKPSLVQRYRQALERNPDPRLRLLDQAMREAGMDPEANLGPREPVQAPPNPPAK